MYNGGKRRSILSVDADVKLYKVVCSESNFCEGHGRVSFRAAFQLIEEVSDHLCERDLQDVAGVEDSSVVGRQRVALDKLIQRNICESLLHDGMCRQPTSYIRVDRSGVRYFISRKMPLRVCPRSIRAPVYSVGVIISRRTLKTGGGKSE